METALIRFVTVIYLPLLIPYLRPKDEVFPWENKEKTFCRSFCNIYLQSRLIFFTLLL